MDIIDQYDLEFINTHCPEGQVPVFFVKGKTRDLGLHAKIKTIYRQISNKIGHHIPCLPAIDEIIVDKAKKDNYVWAYYATPEERDLLRAEKHRLMNYNYRENFSIHTSCFSFNDKGESSDAFHMPLAKIATTFNIDKEIEKIRKNFISYNEHIVVKKVNNLTYQIFYSVYSKNGKDGLNITKLTTKHANLQLKFLEQFNDSYIDFCDIAGNYYNFSEAKSIMTQKATAQNNAKSIDESQIDIDSPDL